MSDDNDVKIDHVFFLFQFIENVKFGKTEQKLTIELKIVFLL